MAEPNKIWKCPKCRRIFRREKQQHSCTVYPVEKHLVGKPYAKGLFLALKEIIKKRIGPFIVESLPCCIHLVNKKAYTFAAVYAMKDRIRLHLVSEMILKGRRFAKPTKMSAKRYLYSVDIKKKSEIDAGLLGVLTKAFDLVE